MKNKLSGFSLVEIMFVVFIISFLVSLAVVEGVVLRKKANEANAQANLKYIATGFEIYAAGHGGAYSSGNETDLQFLVEAKCASQDLVSIGQIGNFRYVVDSITPTGYDIRAMAVNTALADHNYQISTGGLIRRSDSSGTQDADFKDYTS
ncbi:MAG: type II secretion system protein [Candidatus Omnitrophota bacterium]|nr:type II secretion system protein [Candidatus Omnitrophota bacterium]